MTMHVLNSQLFFRLALSKMEFKKKKQLLLQLFWIDQTVQITLTMLLMYNTGCTYYI